MTVPEEGTRVAGVESSAVMLVAVLALSCYQIPCYRGCYRVAGIQERDCAEGTRVAGAEISAGMLVEVLALSCHQI